MVGLMVRTLPVPCVLGTDKTNLRDACQGGAKLGKLRPPCGPHEAAELVHDLKDTALAIRVFVFPSEETDWPFLYGAEARK